MLAAEFFAQIDDANFGEGAIFNARGEFEQMVFSGARVMVSLERRRRGAENRDGALELRAIDGRVAPIVTRRFFLLVSVLLLFIDDDEPEIFERSENGGARPNHNFRFAIAHAPPLAGAFDIRQSAVEHGDGGSEARADEAADPESERDFRDEHDCGFASGKRRFDGPEIDLRFAAARDA